MPVPDPVRGAPPPLGHHRGAYVPGSSRRLARRSPGAHVHVLDGVVHREDGPAVTYYDGSDKEVWVRHGRLHREDGPATTSRSQYFGRRHDYHLRGALVASIYPQREGPDRVAHLLAAGTPAEHLTGYLAFDVAASHLLVREKVPGPVVVAAVVAGVGKDKGAAALVAAAHHRGAPLSWARPRG